MSYYSLQLGTIPVLTSGSAPFTSSWRFLLGPAGLTGWRNRAPDDTNDTEHWSGVGRVAGAKSTGGRPLILEGFIQGKATIPGSTEEGLDALARLSSTTLTVAENARAMARVADVRVIQHQETRISDSLAKVTLTLTADDPLRYSAESRLLVNGWQLLPNRGDVAAFGRLLLTGPHDAITINHPSGAWTFPALASGSRLVDFRERQVWNGNVRVFGEGAGTVPRVPAGGGSWTIAGLGAGTAILTRAEAWS